MAKAVDNSIINDVIAGKYGNGADRRAKLEEAGYDYREVNAAVTARINGDKQTPSVEITAPASSTANNDIAIGNPPNRNAELAATMQEQQGAYDQLMAYQQEMYDEQRKAASLNKENANRNAYIAKEVALKNLPGQLSAQGINGGLAESSLVRLHNNYNRALADNDLQYNETVRDAYKEMLANKSKIDIPTTPGTSGTSGTSGNSASSGSSSGGYLPVNDQIVRDVIAGKYGNGAERQRRLTDAGYDYREVNAAVTAAMGGTGGGTGNIGNAVNTTAPVSLSAGAKAFVSTNMQRTPAAIERAINDAARSGMLTEADVDALMSYYNLW